MAEEQGSCVELLAQGFELAGRGVASQGIAHRSHALKSGKGHGFELEGGDRDAAVDASERVVGCGAVQESRKRCWSDRRALGERDEHVEVVLYRHSPLVRLDERGGQLGRDETTRLFGRRVALQEDASSANQ